MKVRRLLTVLAGLVIAGAGLAPTPAAAQDYELYPLEARVWLDRGDEPVLQRGERSKIYYRVSESAFVAIFHIDTNGTTRMVFPSSPQENHYARGGRDYRVLFPGSSYWHVNDDPGMGYFFIVASPEPFNFRDFGYSHFAGGWDLSYVGQQVYGDPYLAMDDYVGALIPDWEYLAYGLDFTAYHVESHHDYPRFLCYDCHGFRPYNTWNPYSYSCTSFRVLIYNDPYYYPVTRYRGTRVVYVQPRRGVPHFGFKERARGEAGTPQVVVRSTPPVSQPGVAGGEARRAVPRVGSSGNGSSASPAAGSAPARVTPGVAGAGARRTGSGTANGVAPSTRTSGSVPQTGGSSARPVLERRTPPTGASAGRTGTTRPTTRTPLPTPSSKARRPGGGGETTVPRTPVARTTGGTTTRSLPTVRGTGGTSTRTIPKARTTGGTPTRTSPPARTTGGTSSRSTPTVRTTGGTSTRTIPKARTTGGTSTRTSPTVRTTGGSSSRTTPKARTTGGTPSRSAPKARTTGGTASKPPVRTSKPPTPPKRRLPGGGGGGGVTG